MRFLVTADPVFLLTARPILFERALFSLIYRMKFLQANLFPPEKTSLNS